ncbi:spherulation-specific family 4 protein [Dactylosporangium sp. NPDC000521]|uniref:spherulation-specific family 4 protein n=1 Tax=Dactylosporangium sp. NPDC000521 TaxID=3363975 RepID=UPI003682B75D
MSDRHGRGRSRPRALAAALALVVAPTLAPIAPAPAFAGAPTTRTTTSVTADGVGQRLAVPAYFYPGGDGTALWQRLTGPGTGIVVANPFSGPGKTRDPRYAAAIAAARAGGVTVLGYVPTGYLGTTGRATRLGQTTPAAWSAQVQQDIETWYRLYGGDGLGGIFFDEVQNVCGPDGAYARTYRALDEHTRAWHHGAFTVINPGIETEPCYADIGDVILTFEGTYDTYRQWKPPAWHRAMDPRRLWHLVHGTATLDQLDEAMRLSKQRNAGYVYVTPDVLANPWDSLPPPEYWTRELAAAADTGRPDRNPPRVHGGPVPVRVTSTEVTVAWLPATDPGGRVAGYDVLLDGARVAGTTGTEPLATIRGLEPGRQYRVGVAARDVAGNTSTPTPTTVLTTARPDPQPPAAPAGLRASETGVAHTVLSWTAAPERDVTGYEIQLNGTRLLSVPAWLAGAEPSVPISGLEPSTAYTFTVAARDASGNVSPMAGPLTVTTATPSGDPITAATGTIGATAVTYEATFTLPYDFHHVFIDVDGDEGTGFATAGIGADLLIENGWFYRHTGTGWSWEPVDGPSPLVSSADGHYVWQIPAAMAAAPHRVVFHGSGSSPEYTTAVVNVM